MNSGVHGWDVPGMRLTSLGGIIFEVKKSKKIAVMLVSDSTWQLRSHQEWLFEWGKEEESESGPEANSGWGRGKKMRWVDSGIIWWYEP